MQIGAFDEQPGERIAVPESGQVQAVAPGVWRIPLPVPFPPGWVNAYALQGAGEWALVDCGMGTPDSDAALHAGLMELGITFADLDALILTHAHPDHIAAAGDITGAMRRPRVIMLAEEGERMYAAWDVHSPDDFATLRALQLRGGLPADEVEGGVKGWLRLARLMRLPPRAALDLVAEGQILSLAGRDWRTIWTPGHAEWHLCLVSDNLLLAGDHVLPTISPNIGFTLQHRPDPVQDYFDGLDKIAALNLTDPLALPGHGQPFTRLPERIAELRDGHLRRSQHIRATLAANPEPMTALQVAHAVFGARLRTHDDRRLALGETLAHLEHLRLNGQAACELRDGVAYYGAEG